MTKFVKNLIYKQPGYHSIIDDIKIGNHLEVVANDEPIAGEPKVELKNTVCGYVAAIHVNKIDLSPFNPIILLREDCSPERRAQVFSLETKLITYYRKIPQSLSH